MKTDTKVIMVPDFIVFLKQFEHGETFSTTDLQYRTYITYSHLLKIRDALKGLGVLTTTKTGRIVNITITEKGKETVKAALHFLESLGIDDSNLEIFRAKTKLKHKDLFEAQGKIKKNEEPVDEEPLHSKIADAYIQEDKLTDEPISEEDKSHIDGITEESIFDIDVDSEIKEEVEDDNSDKRI